MKEECIKGRKEEEREKGRGRERKRYRERRWGRRREAWRGTRKKQKNRE